MTSHSKAIHQYQSQHAMSEAIGVVGVTLYLGILVGVVAQIAILAGLL